MKSATNCFLITDSEYSDKIFDPGTDLSEKLRTNF